MPLSQNSGFGVSRTLYNLEEMCDCTEEQNVSELGRSRKVVRRIAMAKVHRSEGSAEFSFSRKNKCASSERLKSPSFMTKRVGPLSTDILCGKFRTRSPGIVYLSMTELIKGDKRNPKSRTYLRIQESNPPSYFSLA